MDMDNSSPSQSARGDIYDFAWKSGSVPVSINRNYSAFARRTAAGSEPSRSQLVSSDLSANTGQAYTEFLEQHQSTEVPLDAFDKELLAAEPAGDRRWQASQGLARLFLPPKSIATTRTSSTARKGMREELHSTPRFGNTSSSSPGETASSPTVVALSQRRNHGHTLPLEHDHSSPLARKVAAPSSIPFQPGGKLAPSSRIELGHAPPVVQGIPLVSVNDLPDRLRSLFPFQLFNAVQSRCFATAFQTNENLVLSAPTGSGKTVIMELAICHLMNSTRDGDFKIVYQAPTKALCSERCIDWQAKFGPLDLQCAELTGDTDVNQMRNVRAATIIITTPEKWDSITRRWKDHARLMRLVKLFLIDEVHILKESRGATLEAVVSRMKSTGSSVRFIALSATVPNSEDVATWLGKDSLHSKLPAHREVFGEEFRPVKLQKVVYGYPIKSNDFVFDSILESKLPEIIAKHSQGKPTIIFCPYRKSCVKTAKSLAQLWTSTMSPDRLWSGPSRPPGILDNELRQFVSAGVAFHHAGLDVSDRRAVEQAFLSHNISIICCTSTLAVGVNLPCYLVVIKGTVGWTDNGCQEYADLEMMQMLGRAGRPQFEQSACAVILTRNERVDYYNKLVSGQGPLESCLHLNLIDHLNAEIGLGTVSDLNSAKRWLASTFLFVRLSRNPNHYRLKEDVTNRNDDDLLDQICSKDVALLQGADLVTKEAKLNCTEFGDAMARYYVKFDTMKVFLSLAPKAKLSEIMSAIAQAAEFHDLRLKSGEKSLYKNINTDVGIKFPIKVDIALPAQKVSLLMQAELGGMDFPVGEQFAKHKNQFQQDKAMVFQHVNRLVRCVTDCQLTRGDSVSARHALELARSFAARVWDNSPLQLKQLEHIGNVAVRKLANAGINSIESLENAEAHRIETVIGRGPPFGMKLLSKLAQFPKLRVLVKMTGKEMKPHRCIKIRLKAEIGFLNENIPAFFRRKPIYACFLAETSDGHIIDFRRITASKLQNGHEVLMTAELTKPSQYILCHVMCDEIAGTCRSAELKPNLPASLFPTSTEQKEGERKDEIANHGLNNGKSLNLGRKRQRSEDFNDGGLDDGDLLAAESVEIMDIDAFDEELASLPSKEGQSNNKRLGNPKKQRTEESGGEPVQLKNGKWACNHKCKEKAKCKHLCCQEGLDKPPKPPKKSYSSTERDHLSIASMLDAVNNDFSEHAPSTSTKCQVGSKKSSLDHGAQKQRASIPGAKEARSLVEVHEATTPNVSNYGLSAAMSNPNINKMHGHQSSSAASATSVESVHADLFDLDWAKEIGLEDFEDFANPNDSFGVQHGMTGAVKADKQVCRDDTWPSLDNDDLDFDDNDASMLEASMVGLDDSLQLKRDSNHRQNAKDNSEPNTSFSSGTVHESSTSRFERSEVDDIFDDDDGLHDFDQEHLEAPDPVTSRSSGADAEESFFSPSSDNEPVTSPCKKLFFTSPERARLAPTHASAEDTASLRRHGAGISTPTVNVRAPLEEISNAKAADNVFNKLNQQTQAEAIDHEKEEEEEEQKQKLLDDGIDPSFYDEFKDYVDFI